MGISEDNTICCKTGNCTCHSLSHALVSLNDSDIISVVELSSFASIEVIENVTIVGYNNSTVLCIIIVMAEEWSSTAIISLLKVSFW